MRKAVLALLLCFHALSQAAPPDSPAKEVAAAAASRQQEEPSTAEEVGRRIGVLLKRTTEVLKDVAKGVSEGFRSTPENSPQEGACGTEEARKGRCPPGTTGGKTSAPERESGSDSGLLAALLKALF